MLTAYTSKCLPAAAEKHSQSVRLLGLTISLAAFKQLSAKVDFDYTVYHLALIHTIKISHGTSDHLPKFKLLLMY